MARTRSQKQVTIDSYTEGLASAPHAILVSFQGITVPQDTELRDKIRQQGGSYEVVKNTLALRAVEGKSLESLKEHFVGPTAVAYTTDDPVGLAKALTEFRKDSPVIEFKGGLLDGQPVAAEEVENIANLPSREDLIAKLLFLLQSPITRLARGLAAIPRSLVIALDQVAQNKDG
ncbi:MAG: 50S ribosomal protein L10 [Acidobacteriota bacterium]